MNDPSPLVSPEWVADHLGDRSIRVLNADVLGTYDGDTGAVSFSSGRPIWEQGHIPGSEHVDLLELADPGPFTHTLPRPEAFAERMSALGVGPGIRVVVYDVGLGMHATRLWWMLRVFGFDAVSVLDGGWKAWSDGGLPVSTEPSPPAPPARFEPRFRPELVADTRQVEAYLASGEGCLVKALTPEMFRGHGSVAYRRRGRIPGSVNVPSVAMLDPETFRYKPPEELEAQFREAELLDRDQPVVTYCGAGVAATMTAFGLMLAGREDVAVYDGSMEEWTQDPARPVETG